MNLKVGSDVNQKREAEGKVKESKPKYKRERVGAKIDQFAAVSARACNF